MFERFTGAARGVVVDAQTQARALHHREIRAEHLLLAVLAADTGVSAVVLRDHGVRADRLASDLAGLGAGDRDALHEIGIDLAAVRQRVEAAFGPGALDRPRAGRAGRLRRRTGTGHLRFSRPAKRVLEHSLRQAMSLGHHSITVDHIALGLLADDHDPAAQALRRLGVSPSEVSAEIRMQLRRAA